MRHVGLFDNLCFVCVQFMAEYDGFCDGCASDWEYAWAICLKEHGFKDYSEAVKKIGRNKIDRIFDEGKYFPLAPDYLQKI